jgi:hypothetical protein
MIVHYVLPWMMVLRPRASVQWWGRPAYVGLSRGRRLPIICRDDVNARVARGRRRVEMEAEILKHRLCVVLVPATMETIHSSGGYAVVWRDLDAGGSTARLCILILKIWIELYNYKLNQRHNGYWYSAGQWYMHKIIIWIFSLIFSIINKTGYKSPLTSQSLLLYPCCRSW